MSFKKRIILLFCLQFLLTNSYIYTVEDFSDEIDDLTNEISIDDNKADQPKATNCDDFSNLAALGIIVAANVASILQEDDLYLRTNPLNKRPIITLPIFNLYHLNYSCSDLNLKFSLFGNATHKQFFSGDSPYLSSYLALQDQNIINKLKESPLVSGVVPLIVSSLDLTKCIKVEERRIGLMTQILKNYNNFSLEIDIPFFYQEKNFILTEQEIHDIKTALPGGSSDVDSKEVEREFRQHVVSDRIGFGDTRLKLGCFLIQDSNFCAKIGLQSTIPTAFSLKNGIIGSDFIKNLNTPNIDLRLLTCLGLQAFNGNKDAINQLKEIGIPIGFDALNRLSAMVLDDPLGNDHHFGLGGFFESKIKINDYVTIFSNANGEYLFPSYEKRFFLKKKFLDIPKFKQDIADENEKAATEDMEMLDKAVQETLFPTLLEIKVFPKWMLQFTIGANFKIREWDFNFGYDIWWQQKEKFGNICNEELFKIEKGKKDAALQNKLFAQVSYNKIKRNYDWKLALLFEDAFSTNGIGKDFTAAIQYEVNF